MAQPSQSIDDRMFVRRVLIVIGLVALALLAWQLRQVVVMLFGAVVVAAVFRSLADPICRWSRMPSGVSVAIAVAIVFGALALLVAFFGVEVRGQIDQLGATLPEAVKSLEERVGDNDFVRRALATAREGASGGIGNFGRIIMSIGNAAADALVIIFGGIFLAAQPRFYKTGAIKLVPEAKRDLVSSAMDDSERALRLWLKGQLIAMVAVGLMTGLGLWLLGMQSALALGLLAGLLEFVPFAGPIIAAIPAVLIALAVNPEMALWVVLLYTAVQQVESYLLQPLVQQYAVDLPGVVLLFSLIAFGILFGAIGVLFAAPLAVVTYVMVKKLYVRETLGTETPIPGEDKG
ncbi:AI-2E family transporter [Sphingomonas piscis]|uniref:AI-2E family transporter n=1 Tax=Sphingomonas piscis TaxID=2714943 RepID=A0A6G7YR33_9SPHN|nr:AI-2E family transporter [Sphingomonas piscis]QIK79196.1 AI-2E family transporter [Sphingomonas piscis]